MALPSQHLAVNRPASLDPTNHSADCFQYCAWVCVLDMICAGVGGSGL